MFVDGRCPACFFQPQIVAVSPDVLCDKLRTIEKACCDDEHGKSAHADQDRVFAAAISSAADTVGSRQTNRKLAHFSAEPLVFLASIGLVRRLVPWPAFAMTS